MQRMRLQINGIHWFQDKICDQIYFDAITFNILKKQWNIVTTNFAAINTFVTQHNTEWPGWIFQ